MKRRVAALHMLQHELSMLVNAVAACHARRKALSCQQAADALPISNAHQMRIQS
jgi:hypothetical protein